MYLAVKYISDGNPDIKLSNTELKSLFSVATAQTHFIFEGSFYDQIDGVAMSSPTTPLPLAPILSNLFMGHHEKLWLENFQDSETLFHRRYVDDTFCLFHWENQALLFFNYINSRHPNIRFTMEKEIDHKIPFLDVLYGAFKETSISSLLFRKRQVPLLSFFYLDFVRRLFFFCAAPFFYRRSFFPTVHFFFRRSL